MAHLMHSNFPRLCHAKVMFKGHTYINSVCESEHGNKANSKVIGRILVIVASMWQRKALASPVIAHNFIHMHNIIIRTQSASL